MDYTWDRVHKEERKRKREGTATERNKKEEYIIDPFEELRVAPLEEEYGVIPLHHCKPKISK